MARKVTVIPANPSSDDGKGGGKKLRVAAYCRVSTDQEDQLGSFANQVEYYNKLLASRSDWEMAGLFADEGISGTGTRKRSGFLDMITACEEGRVDLVITKSISRFARNTADCLNYSRKLKKMGIPIIFEKEGINTMEATGELLFTILSSLAQEESRNIAENTRWGIRSKFQQGIPHLNTEYLMGYDKGPDGNLVINEEQAVVIRRIYKEFLEGWNCSEIASRLNQEGICGIHDRPAWLPATIERVLKNEKHVGDLLMQKTYTADYLTKRQVVNDGRFEQYYIKDAHPAIIRRDLWDAAQLELIRRHDFRLRHKVHTIGSMNFDPMFARLFCPHCGGKLVRKNGISLRKPVWRCENTYKEKGHKCKAAMVREEAVKRAIVIMWNFIVEHQEQFLPIWKEQEKTGDALLKYRAKSTMALLDYGPMVEEVPEMTRMLLEEALVWSPTEIEISLLCGVRRTVLLD